MCNLYEVGPSPVNSRTMWEKLVKQAFADMPAYVAPGKPGPIIRVAATEGPGEFLAEEMRWGFHRPWGPCINNARDDKLEGRTWNPAWKGSRCILPVRRFYEWSGEKGAKVKHGILADPDTWFWIAGIWEVNPTPGIGPSYSMLTTSANEQMKGIHDRMPVILSDEDLEEYLQASKPPRHLVKPYAGDLVIDPPVIAPWF